MKKNNDMFMETMLAHYGEDKSMYHGSVIPPIFQTSLFTFENMEAISNAFNTKGSYLYTRGLNPTVEVAEKKIAKLECGERAKLFSSGMGAISASILNFVKTGDHIVALKTVYGPTINFFSKYLANKFNIKTTYVEATTDNVIDAIKDNTTLIYLESPTSLVFEVLDLKKIAAVAKKRGIGTVIDNTWATPLYQNPLTMGIDVVVHSASKYLSGHSDVVAGVAVASEETIQSIFEVEHALLGAKIAPIEAWLILRGLRTLPVRMKHHSESALKIALYLEKHPKIKKVNHPGLKSHPNYELAKQQLSGYSGLFSFVIDSDLQGTRRFVDNLQFFNIGVSWGGFESLALNLAYDGKNKNVETGLVRVSIGLENTNDLLADIEQALKLV